MFYILNSLETVDICATSVYRNAFTLQAPGIRETKQFIPERPVPEGTHLQLKQIETK